MPFRKRRFDTNLYAVSYAYGVPVGVIDFPNSAEQLDPSSIRATIAERLGGSGSCLSHPLP